MAGQAIPFRFDRDLAADAQPAGAQPFSGQDRRRGSSFGGRRKSDHSEHALDAEALRAELAHLRDQQKEELDRTRREAFQAGLDHARTERDAAILSSIDALQASVEEVLSNRDALLAEFSQDAANLALVAAEAIAGHAIALDPGKTVDDAIGRVLAQLARGDDVQVAVHPDLVEGISAKIEARKSDNRKNISLTVVSNDALAPGDAVLAWDRGGVTIDIEARKKAIHTELEPLLAGPKG